MIPYFVFLAASLMLCWIFFSPKKSNHYLVYDIESIRDENQVHTIVLIGYYDSKYNRYSYDVYPNFRRFKKIVKKRKTIVGFNSLSFDDPICRLQGIEVESTFDIYERMVTAVKHHAKHKIRTGYSLDSLGQKNLGQGKYKTKGGSVRESWEKGDIEGLAKYCLQDVRLTVELYKRRRNIKDPNNNQKYDLENIMAKV